MNDIHLSISTKKLLAAAKGDLPSAAARAKVWAGVSGAVGGAAAAGATGITSSAVLSGGAGATKLVAIGTLFGGTVAVGLATALLQIGPPRTVPPSATLNAPAAMAQPAPANPTHPLDATSAAAANQTDHATATAPAAPGESANSLVPARKQHRAAKPVREDALAREASLVAEARSALGRGDPRSALHAIRTARALPSKQLVPEELAVEEQALRALGQSDQANGIDVMLRLEYPESALAR